MGGESYNPACTLMHALFLKVWHGVRAYVLLIG